jgi:hypothetical protein
MTTSKPISESDGAPSIGSIDSIGAVAALEQDPRVLVAALARARGHADIWNRLVAIGPDAREAVREGLNHGHWQVRRWCALWLDHYADAESLRALVPLLRDPKCQVRLFVVHSLACDRCKDGDNPVDVVPLLIERIRC